MIETDGAGAWRARIERPIGYMALNIWLYRFRDGKTEFLLPDGMIYIVHDGYELPKEVRPVLRLAVEDGRQMMYALMDALAEEGIKLPDSKRLEGRLEAQAEHLKDLRKLLKLNRGMRDE